jgi:hypothetical protein
MGNCQQKSSHPMAYQPLASAPSLGSLNLSKREGYINHLIARLFLSTTVYSLRQERNRRIFNNHFQRLVNSNEYVMS